MRLLLVAALLVSVHADVVSLDVGEEAVEQAGAVSVESVDEVRALARVTTRHC